MLSEGDISSNHILSYAYEDPPVSTSPRSVQLEAARVVNRVMKLADIDIGVRAYMAAAKKLADEREAKEAR